MKLLIFILLIVLNAQAKETLLTTSSNTPEEITNINILLNNDNSTPSCSNQIIADEVTSSAPVIKPCTKKPDVVTNETFTFEYKKERD